MRTVFVARRKLGLLFLLFVEISPVKDLLLVKAIVCKGLKWCAGKVERETTLNLVERIESLVCIARLMRFVKDK